MRDRLFARLEIAALACFVAVAGCKYDPHPADGALRCDVSGECPDGYSCQAKLCFSTSGLSRDAGLGGTAITPATKNRYVGDWAMGTTSTVETLCDDGFDDVALLSPDEDDPSIIYLAEGIPGVADLDSSWLCELYLSLDDSGAHLFDANPTCTDTTAGADPVNTWTATRFDIVANSGTTAWHVAFYNRVDRWVDGHVVNCMQTVRAPLTRIQN